MKKVWTGDSGRTRIFCEETTKDSLRVDAYGDVDELNSYIGLARAQIKDRKVNDILAEIQNELFIIGADLAKAGSKGDKKAILTKDHVKLLEERVGIIEKDLPEIKKFIVPAGTHAAATLHVARSVCRRAERKTVALKKSEIVNDEIVKYLNRLSTLLFDLARLVNKREGVKEEHW